MLLLARNKSMRVYDVAKRVSLERFKVDFDRIRTMPHKTQDVCRDFELDDDSMIGLADLMSAFSEAAGIKEIMEIKVVFRRSSSHDDYPRYQGSNTHKSPRGLLCVARRNARGGRDVFKAHDGRTLYSSEPLPGRFVVYDSLEVDHYRTRVTSIVPKYEGHVDTIDVSFI